MARLSKRLSRASHDRATNVSYRGKTFIGAFWKYTLLVRNPGWRFGHQAKRKLVVATFKAPNHALKMLIASSQHADSNQPWWNLYRLTTTSAYMIDPTPLIKSGLLIMVIALLGRAFKIS